MKSLLTNILYITLCTFLFLTLSEEVDSRLILTDEEAKALAKFRPLVKGALDEDWMNRDAYLIRYLRWGKLDVNRSVQKLKDVHDWRKRNNMRNILNEDLVRGSAGKPDLYDINTVVDREGEPVFIFAFGAWDLRKVSVAGNAAQMVRHWDQMIEGLDKRIRDLDQGSNNVTRFSIVCDLAGYSVRTHGCLNCLGITMQFPRHLMTYWPEIWKRIIVINVPQIFVPPLNIMKEFVINSQGNGIESFASNRVEWEPYVRKYIAPEQLPYRYGGTRKY